MNNVIIIRYGEIFLKGKNRDYFESLAQTENGENGVVGINLDTDSTVRERLIT